MCFSVSLKLLLNTFFGNIIAYLLIDRTRNDHIESKQHILFHPQEKSFLKQDLNPVGMFQTLKLRFSRNHLIKYLIKRQSQLNLILFTQKQHFPVGPAGENSHGSFILN